MAPSRTERHYSRSFSLPPPSALSLTIASVGWRLGAPGLSSTGFIRRPVTPYDPNVVFKDKDAPYDPEPEVSSFYVDQVKVNFSDKKILATFDDVVQEYVPWEVPLYGIDTLALHMPRLTPGYCHHRLNQGRSLEWSRLHIVHCMSNDPRVLDGVKGYLTPLTHTCIAQPVFHFNDRRQASRQLQHQNTIQEDTQQDGNNDEEDEDVVARTLLQSSSQSASSQSASSQSANQGSLTEEADDEATFYTDQVCYTHSDLLNACNSAKWIVPPTGCPLHATPFTLPTPPPSSPAKASASPLKAKLLYSQQEANLRKLTDTAMVSSILDAAETGDYHYRPYLHPAFQTRNIDDTPAALKQYHNHRSSFAAFTRMGHLRGTDVGTLIFLFNSITGISVEQFAELRKRAHKCASCLCYFSWYGYQQHVEYDMRCKNTPQLEDVPDLSVVFARLPTIPVDKWPAGNVPFCEDVLYGPIGLAWMSWNTRSGVTHDTWVHLITCWRRCPGGCGLVRSFDGHAKHIKNDPVCSLAGDPGLSP